MANRTGREYRQLGNIYGFIFTAIGVGIGCYIGYQLDEAHRRISSEETYYLYLYGLIGLIICGLIGAAISMILEGIGNTIDYITITQDAPQYLQMHPPNTQQAQYYSQQPFFSQQTINYPEHPYAFQHQSIHLCPNCGANMEPDCKFCQVCGTKL